MINPQTGKLTTLHTLCPVSDGEFKARELLQVLLGSAHQPKGDGDFCAWIDKWRMLMLKKHDKKRPRDPARIPTFEKGRKNLTSAINVIEEGFKKFDVSQVKSYDVAQFLDFWQGQRAAQVYKSYLSKFFSWCISRHALMDINPAEHIELDSVDKREVYMTDDQFLDIYDALLIGFDGKPTRTGEMVQCYMDLLYLLYQRGTEIRLMRWDKIKPQGILFKPTKTENTTGKEVIVQVGEDVRAVLDRIKSISNGCSTFIIHTEQGTPYTASGIRTLFNRAAERAGISGVTLKDIRSKAASDAKKSGYTEEQIQVALVHAEIGTTQDYIRDQPAPVSDVIMKLPKREKQIRFTKP